MADSERRIINGDTAQASGVEQLRGMAENRRMKLAVRASDEIRRLRESGEYAAADNLLDTMQSMLHELKSLESWAIENRETIEKFEEKADDWESSCEDAMKDVYGIAPPRPMAEETRKLLEQSGRTLLDAGVMPSPAQLSAMGVTESEAQMKLTAQKLKSAEADTGRKPKMPGRRDRDIM